MAGLFDGYLAIRQLAENLVTINPSVAKFRLRGCKPRGEFERRRIDDKKIATSHFNKLTF
jgi:hypothetical protein